MPSSACAAPAAISALSLHDALPIYALEAAVSPVLDAADRERLLHGTHHDPHSVLGVHPVRGGVAFRAFRPYARSVTVVTDDRRAELDRKSTRLNSSHMSISYAVFCLCGTCRHLRSFPTRRSSDLRPGSRRLPRSGCRRPRAAAARHPSRPALRAGRPPGAGRRRLPCLPAVRAVRHGRHRRPPRRTRSEEHTSELQSHVNLVCRLLLVRHLPPSPLFPYTTLFRSTPWKPPSPPFWMPPTASGCCTAPITTRTPCWASTRCGEASPSVPSGRTRGPSRSSPTTAAPN